MEKRKTGPVLSVLSTSILPVFGLLALGFGMGRFGWTSQDEARALNRFSMLVAGPALMFSLLATVDARAFSVDALGVYVWAGWILFALAFVVARYILQRGPREAVLLGMSVMFVNTLLYIWPISFLIYGAPAALPITAIVAWDSAISFSIFICAMEIMTPGRSLLQATGRILRNPILLSVAAGIAMNLARIPVPVPLDRFTAFAGSAAAPLTLFAVGVILSAQSIWPDRTTVVMSALKLLVLPGIVWIGTSLFAVTGNWADLSLLAAAGPSGAMAFALAVLYGVRSDTIARIIIWTSFLSLFSLAYLA